MMLSRCLCTLVFIALIACDADEPTPEAQMGGTEEGGGGSNPTAGARVGGAEAGNPAPSGGSAGGKPEAGVMMGGTPRAGEPVAGSVEGGAEGDAEQGGEPVVAGAGGGSAGGSTNPSLTHVYPGATEGQVILSNAPRPCERRTTISPYLPDEAGHHAGSILTPSSYPFTVSMIEYTLEEPPDIPSCKSELAHRLELSVLSAEQPPPASPSSEAIRHISLEVPQAMAPTERRVILQNLADPITLNEGERLLVSVSLIAEGADHLCIAACEDEPARRGAEFWSNAPQAPYDWAELGSFGLTSELMISVIAAE